MRCSHLACALLSALRDLGPLGTSWIKADLDAFFRTLLAFVAETARARQLSIHSFRVWLACALLAAGATPEQIMLLLRWSSDAARKLYARLSERVQVSQLNAACDVNVDSIRSHTMLLATLPASAAAAGHASGAPAAPTAATAGAATSALAAEDAGQVLLSGMTLLAAAHEFRGTLPATTELPQIDDDDAHARLNESSDALRVEGMAADKALTGTQGNDSSEESSDNAP